MEKVLSDVLDKKVREITYFIRSSRKEVERKRDSSMQYFPTNGGYLVGVHRNHVNSNPYKAEYLQSQYRYAWERRKHIR